MIKCIAGAFKKKLQKLVKLYFEFEAFKKKKIQPDNYKVMMFRRWQIMISSLNHYTVDCSFTKFTIQN